MQKWRNLVLSEALKPNVTRSAYWFNYQHYITRPPKMSSSYSSRRIFSATSRGVDLRQPYPQSSHLFPLNIPIFPNATGWL